MQPRAPAEVDTAESGQVTDRQPPSSCACPHTSAPCPAVSSLLGHAPSGGPGAREWMKRLTPCGSCRIGFEARRRALRGMRLGQREREVLCGAASADVFTVTEPGMGRALNAARRRAAQTLIRAGLVVAPQSANSQPTPETPAYLARAAVSLTPMGRYVMSAFGRYIEASKPVRWTRPAASARLPGEDPATLVSEAMELARRELHATLQELKHVLIAAVGRPVRDPGLLETVTRGLHDKAQGLRALLAAPPPDDLRKSA